MAKRPRPDDGFAESATSSGLSIDDLFSVREASLAPTSPTPSETSHGSGRGQQLDHSSLGLDESSNEALVVDYDSPTGESGANGK